MCQSENTKFPHLLTVVRRRSGNISGITVCHIMPYMIRVSEVSDALPAHGPQVPAKIFGPAGGGGRNRNIKNAGCTGKNHYVKTSEGRKRWITWKNWKQRAFIFSGRRTGSLRTCACSGRSARTAPCPYGWPAKPSSDTFRSRLCILPP